MKTLFRNSFPEFSTSDSFLGRQKPSAHSFSAISVNFDFSTSQLNYTILDDPATAHNLTRSSPNFLYGFSRPNGKCSAWQYKIEATFGFPPYIRSSLIKINIHMRAMRSRKVHSPTNNCAPECANFKNTHSYSLRININLPMGCKVLVGTVDNITQRCCFSVFSYFYYSKPANKRLENIPVAVSYSQVYVYIQTIIISRGSHYIKTIMCTLMAL